MHGKGCAMNLLRNGFVARLAARWCAALLVSATFMTALRESRLARYLDNHLDARGGRGWKRIGNEFRDAKAKYQGPHGTRKERSDRSDDLGLTVMANPIPLVQVRRMPLGGMAPALGLCGAGVHDG
jgi:hypothetical protein